MSPDLTANLSISLTDGAAIPSANCQSLIASCSPSKFDGEYLVKLTLPVASSTFLTVMPAEYWSLRAILLNEPTKRCAPVDFVRPRTSNTVL